MMAEIFVGNNSLVSNVYPMQFSKQFVNTLEDNIRFRGAMNKLMSDYAQAEISKKVQDIIRMYHSSSWHSEPYHQNQRSLLNGGIESLRLGPTSSFIDLEHLQTPGCSA